MRILVDQLKQRGVFRAAAYYAAGAWLVVQVATAVFPFLEFPNWSVRLIIVSATAGFPVAMLVSWFYRWTPSGLRREIEPSDRASVGLNAAPAAPARENAIAVLPFADLSPRESQAALGELESKHAVGFSYQIAQAHAWRGERDAAFEWFERAYAQRDAGVTRMRGDPMLAPLRDDPRYAALVRKLNFPD